MSPTALVARRPLKRVKQTKKKLKTDAFSVFGTDKLKKPKNGQFLSQDAMFNEINRVVVAGTRKMLKKYKV